MNVAVLVWLVERHLAKCGGYWTTRGYGQSKTWRDSLYRRDSYTFIGGTNGTDV